MMGGMAVAVAIGIIMACLGSTQGRQETFQPTGTGGIYVLSSDASMPADFAGFDTVELCDDTCLDWKRSWYTSFRGYDDTCYDGGPANGTALLDLAPLFCPLGTDCSACGPRTAVEFNSIQEAVGNFTNEDGVFDGSLYVESTALTTLDGMQPVTRVTGSLALRYNAELEDITSLRSLESVDIMLLLQQNLLPGPLLGLESLSDVGVKLDFYNNTLLETIDSLDALEESKGAVYISEHPALTSITMNKLRTIGAYPRTDQYLTQLYVGANPQLKDASFDSLEYIEWDRQIFESKQLSHLNTGELVSCGSYVLFYGGGPSLVGGSKLETVFGFFEIDDNTNVTYVAGYDNLRAVEDDSVLTISYNGALEGIFGFANLTTVSGPYLKIRDNPTLYSIRGFNSLVSLPGDLILNNTALAKFEAFENLEFVGGCCELEPAWLLSSLPACEGRLCE